MLFDESEHPDYGIVRSVHQDTGFWFVAPDIAKLLQYKSTYGLVKIILAVHKQPTKVYSTQEGRYRKGTLIHEDGIQLAIQRSRLKVSSDRLSWLMSLLVQNNTMILACDESAVLATIEQLLNITLLRQYNVGSYRVDGYDPKTNTVYEVDEKAHLYQESEDAEREMFIKKELNCTFIRIKL